MQIIEITMKSMKASGFYVRSNLDALANLRVSSAVNQSCDTLSPVGEMQMQMRLQLQMETAMRPMRPLRWMCVRVG